MLTEHHLDRLRTATSGSERDPLDPHRLKSGKRPSPFPPLLLHTIIVWYIDGSVINTITARHRHATGVDMRLNESAHAKLSKADQWSPRGQTTCSHGERPADSCVGDRTYRARSIDRRHHCPPRKAIAALASMEDRNIAAISVSP